MLNAADLGFRVVPGTGGNRYYPPAGWQGKTQDVTYKGRELDGPTVSRRQIRSLIAQRHGYTSQAQYEYRNSTLLKRDARYNNFTRIYREEHRGQNPGVQSGFLEKYLQAKDLLDGDRKSKAYRSPDGPVAQFLVAVGLRRDDSRIQVGGS